MRNRGAIACAVIVAGLVAGCSERVPTTDRSTNEPGKPSAAPAAAPSAVAVSQPDFKPSSEALSNPSVKLSFRRWAVISASDAQQGGLGDLVTVELSQVKGLELVERDRLDAVTRELQLADVGESQSAATRLKMGQLLKADALLILSLEGSEKSRALKVVVSECLCGARLRIEYLPYDRTAPADLARRCAEIVAGVREHFAGGVRQIVGVSPFLSKDLVHNYDYLQLIFARLLEAGLTALPHVAVIEIEEARAIGRETSLAGASIQDRPTPLLVEGEYTVSRGAEGKCDVQLELTCQGAGSQRRTIRPPSLPLVATARFLTSDLPPQILPQNAATSPAVSPEEQARWLVARAQAFAQVGSRDEAMGLLEAAVLLAPDDFSLRLKLLAVYGQYLKSRGEWLSGRPEQVVRRHVPSMIEAFLAYLGHLEYLIRNRRLNGIQAIAAFQGPSPFCIWPNYSTSATSHGSSLLFHDLFQPLTQAEERFSLEVYPQIFLLPVGRPRENPEFSAIFFERTPSREDGLHKLWLGELVGWFVKERASVCDMTPHDLDFLYRLLTEVVPDRCGTPPNLMQFLKNRNALRHPFSGHAPDAITDDDWVAFLRRLAASKHRMASLYGRYGLLCQERSTHHASGKLQEPTAASLTEVEAWLKDYAAVDEGVADRNPKLREEFYNSVEAMRKRLAYKSKPHPDTAVSRPPVKAATRHEVVHDGSKLGTAVARLKFDDIELRGFKSDGFNNLLACGEHCDLLWQEHALAIIAEKGRAKEIQQLETRFVHVCWDGRQIWIATSSQGIWLLSLEGKISKIGTDQGLPPADRGLVLHVLSPGKVCAAGSFGEHSRAWCAIVEIGDGGPKVNVFHQATHVGQTHDSGDDPQRTFVPSAFCDYDPGDGASHKLLLVRAAGLPLAIDPATLKVCVTDGKDFPQFGFKDRYINRKGDILAILGPSGEVVQLARPGTSFSDGTTTRPLSIEDPDKGPRATVGRAASPDYRGVRHGTNPAGGGLRGSRLLEYRGAIYIPGLNRQAGYEALGGGLYAPRFNRSEARWFRVDAETLAVEVLDPGPTYPARECWYSVSNHYGLVGGCPAIGRSPGRFFRVSVEETGASDTPPGENIAGFREASPDLSGLVLRASPDAGPVSPGADTGKAEIRTWTSAGGGFHVQARLVEASSDAVVLEKENGVRVTMLRAKLSQADLEYLARRTSGNSGSPGPAQSGPRPPDRPAGGASPGDGKSGG